MSKISKKWLFSLVAVLSLALVITGCTTDDPNETELEEDVDQAADSVEDAADTAGDEVEDAVQDAEDEVRDMNYEDIVVTPEEAFDKFMELYPDAKINQIDLDKELMEYQYVVEGYDAENDYEVKINPVDGKIISQDEEILDMDDDILEITKDHLVKIPNLIEMAKLEDASGSELDEWSISEDDGRLVMDIEIGTKEYSYDMDTEELLESDM